MVVAKLDDFCQLDWNIVDPLIVKYIICGFRDSNVGNVLHAKYFKGRKDEHYKQDSSYILAKVCVFAM
jgi:hypothetical protein